MMKPDPEIHAMTLAEIDRQKKALVERRTKIINERAAIYASSKSGGRAEIIDLDERAARAYARTLLNGAAPETLALPPEVDRDRLFFREQRGIDIALKVLGSNELAARAAAAVAWAEANDAEWRKQACDDVLAANRAVAQRRRSVQFLERCPDIFAVRMPLGGKLDGREVPLDELNGAALAEGIVTLADIRKATDNV